MLFQSVAFLFVFLPLTVVAFALAMKLSTPVALGILSLASIVFYGAHEPVYILLLLASACANYFIAGHIIGKNRSLYIAAVVGNLLLLGVFKYVNFVVFNVQAVTGMPLPLVNIILPLAISFITFEQIAFLTDVHGGRYNRGTILEYGAFITFFPKLIAGPIIRYSEFYPQLEKLGVPGSAHILTGLCILSLALAKKLLGADYFGGLSDQHYNTLATGGSLTTGDAWIAFLAYPLQIYLDFSAYSEMAIGIAWMMGLRLPINFDSPYKATSIIDFWRRWHITLSAFLRDYVYFPLGGNRAGKIRRYGNLMAVMLVGGLWHGAAWTFVVWGGIHGIMLAINHLWREYRGKREHSTSMLAGASGWILTMGVVLVAWVFFRSPDFATAAKLLSAMNPAAGRGAGTLSWQIVLALATGWIICVFCPNLPTIMRFLLDREKFDWSRALAIPIPSWPLVAAAACCFVVSVLYVLSGLPTTFIYFQF